MVEGGVSVVPVDNNLVNGVMVFDNGDDVVYFKNGLFRIVVFDATFIA